jgi:hypothetical protein
VFRIPFKENEMSALPGVIFYDATEGRTMKYVDPESKHRAAGWLLYKHPDGQWVTLRKADSADLEIIANLANRGEKDPREAVPVSQPSAEDVAKLVGAMTDISNDPHCCGLSKRYANEALAPWRKK